MSAIKDDKPVIKTHNSKVGGDNVVQFPLNKPEIKRTQLERELEYKQKLLRFHFKNIKAAQEKLSQLHVICNAIEDEYDEILKEYADRIGVENVAYKYMEYSKHVKPVSTKDGIVLEFDEP